MRWPRERDFDSLIVAAATSHQLDPDLVKGLIGQESQFDPGAIGDDGSSLGLMQVQAQAARDVGIIGDLLDPIVNVAAGTAYLAKQIARAGAVDAGISAYNGGYRPSMGFGKPLPTGSFRNQAYVDHVKANWAYFRNQHPAQPTVDPSGGVSLPGGQTLALIGVGLLVVAAIAVALLR